MGGDGGVMLRPSSLIGANLITLGRPDILGTMTMSRFSSFSNFLAPQADP
jgi:hypothetical protein